MFYVQMHFFIWILIRKQWTEVAFKIVQHGPQLFVFHTSLDMLLHLMAMLFWRTTVQY